MQVSIRRTESSVVIEKVPYPSGGRHYRIVRLIRKDGVDGSNIESVSKRFEGKGQMQKSEAFAEKLMQKYNLRAVSRVGGA